MRKPVNLTILHDIDAAFIGGAGIAPRRRRRGEPTAAGLHQRAKNREPGITEIGEWQYSPAP